MPEYATTRESQRFHQEQMNNNQPGDPVKGVAAIIAATEVPNPPVHLFLGSDAYQIAQQKRESMSIALAQWKSLTTSTDF